MRLWLEASQIRISAEIALNGFGMLMESVQQLRKGMNMCGITSAIGDASKAFVPVVNIRIAQNAIIYLTLHCQKTT
jgi:hypothetical protein